MASCLVPDFPAVMVALEHLKEVDKQLKEDGAPFSLEASFHLAEITAAVTELEAERRAAHEHLEVETIENSKLRHQINNVRERMSQDIMEDVAAARTSNADEMEQLHKDLNTVSQQQETTVKRQEILYRQNEALHAEREPVMAEHRDIIAVLNDQITFKYSLQIQLGQIREQIEELKSCTAAVEQDQITLQQNMEVEREASTMKKDKLSREVEQVEGRFKHQKQGIGLSQSELKRVNDKKGETYNHQAKLTIHTAKLESSLRRLSASRCQCEGQLGGETQKFQDLRQQGERLKKELCELRDAFSAAVQSLQEETAIVEGKMEEGRASTSVHQDSLAQIYELFKRQHDEETEVQTEYLHVSQQLERSKLQLEERIASIVKHGKEVNEMDKQVRELLEADTINKRVFEKNQEEMCSNVDMEKKNIGRLKEEKRHLTRLLEEAGRKQEEHVTKMTSDINSTRRRYQGLLQEEAALQRHQPKSADAEMLMSHVTQCEVEYRQKETKHHEEIVWYTAMTDSIARNNEEKQKEMEKKEEMLKDVEAKWEEEQYRHQRLKGLTSELMRKRKDLEQSIQVLKEETSSALQPKEKLKAELEELRAIYMDTLDEQASELRAVERSIYDHRVKLEQVSMENSRLRLWVTQMTEGVGKARENKARYWQQGHQSKQDSKALTESLQEAWREDLLVTKNCQSSDSVLLGSINTMLSHLKARRQQLGDVSTLLHQQMLDFSKRLGDKSTVR
ncbi:coiled-coil domain-containing protein 175 [Pempheris klunzingeri]|uniref:coiled-coil domain-containing protein 175 n=1 Tax=Pempheris klunzingeri TaxID=3127111 RepID=UPI00397EA4A8